MKIVVYSSTQYLTTGETFIATSATDNVYNLYKRIKTEYSWMMGYMLEVR